MLSSRGTTQNKQPLLGSYQATTNQLNIITTPSLFARKSPPPCAFSTHLNAHKQAALSGSPVAVLSHLPGSSCFPSPHITKGANYFLCTLFHRLCSGHFERVRVHTSMHVARHDRERDAPTLFGFRQLCVLLLC